MTRRNQTQDNQVTVFERTFTTKSNAKRAALSHDPHMVEGVDYAVTPSGSGFRIERLFTREAMNNAPVVSLASVTTITDVTPASYGPDEVDEEAPQTEAPEASESTTTEDMPEALPESALKETPQEALTVEVEVSPQEQAPAEDEASHEAPEAPEAAILVDGSGAVRDEPLADENGRPVVDPTDDRLGMTSMEHLARMTQVAVSFPMILDATNRQWQAFNHYLETGSFVATRPVRLPVAREAVQPRQGHPAAYRPRTMAAATVTRDGPVEGTVEARLLAMVRADGVTMAQAVAAFGWITHDGRCHTFRGMISTLRRKYGLHIALREVDGEKRYFLTDPPEAGAQDAAVA